MGERKQGTVVLSADELHDLVTNAVREALANTNASQPEYLNLAQAAEVLNASQRSVRNWAKDGGLPALRAGTEYRFRRDSVLQWMERRPAPKLRTVK